MDSASGSLTVEHTTHKLCGATLISPTPELGVKNASGLCVMSTFTLIQSSVLLMAAYYTPYVWLNLICDTIAFEYSMLYFPIPLSLIICWATISSPILWKLAYRLSPILSCIVSVEWQVNTNMRVLMLYRFSLYPSDSIICLRSSSSSFFSKTCLSP